MYLRKKFFEKTDKKWTLFVCSLENWKNIWKKEKISGKNFFEKSRKNELYRRLIWKIHFCKIVKKMNFIDDLSGKFNFRKFEKMNFITLWKFLKLIERKISKRSWYRIICMDDSLSAPFWCIYVKLILTRKGYNIELHKSWI